MPYDRSLAIVERHQSLIALITVGGRSAEGLAKALGVSQATINRDVSYLRSKGYDIAAQRQAAGWAFTISGASAVRITLGRRRG